MMARMALKLGRKGRQAASEPSSGSPATRQDEDLVRALYDEHAAALFAYVVRLTSGDRHWAEDIVQEALVRAWRNAEKLEFDSGSIRPWLFTVARRLVIDGQRRRAARPQEVGPAPLDLVPAADEIDRSLSALAIADALNTLSPQHRAVIIEMYFHGRTVSEAAKSLDIPPGTVKSRAFYALRSLRLALEERGMTSDA
jgi:RNA polymerase sigma-70 factor, ECF subfamily